MRSVGEVVECPAHNGNFDCLAFCAICEGEQEYTYTGELPCKGCLVWIDDDVWRKQLGCCVDCLIYLGQ